LQKVQRIWHFHYLKLYIYLICETHLHGVCHGLGYARVFQGHLTWATPFFFFWKDLYCLSVSLCQISSIYFLAVRVLEIFWVYRLYAEIYKSNLT